MRIVNSEEQRRVKDGLVRILVKAAPFVPSARDSVWQQAAVRGCGMLGMRRSSVAGRATRLMSVMPV